MDPLFLGLVTYLTVNLLPRSVIVPKGTLRGISLHGGRVGRTITDLIEVEVFITGLGTEARDHPSGEDDDPKPHDGSPRVVGNQTLIGKRELVTVNGPAEITKKLINSPKVDHCSVNSGTGSRGGRED